MSTVPRTHSDSEDDDDYVPPACEELDSDSEDENQSKRQRVEPSESGEKQRNRDALWASFQTSVVSQSGQQEKEAEVRKMVKVQRRYLFAGDYTSEIVEVPADSPDAKKWPVYEEPEDKTISESPSTPHLGAAPSLPSASATPPATDSTAPPKLFSNKPGPRKSKKVLGALPSASSQKVKKLTTLDKSLMDWKAHTQGTPLQDELEANRKGGGYLDKVEFLQRVDERKEENLEAMRVTGITTDKFRALQELILETNHRFEMSHCSTIMLFPQYRTISTQLSGLPAELVHKILSDIQLSKLLALLCVHPNTYLDQCVSSHLDLRRVLPARGLSDIKHLFSIYLRILQRKPQHCRSIKIKLLDTDAQVLLQKKERVASKEIAAAIRVAISNEFLGCYAKLLPVYKEYHEQHHTGIVLPPSHTWSSLSTSDLEYLFGALSAADDGIRQTQQQQLLRLATLVRDHHHMLKTANDPSQEPRTESYRLHLVARYESLATRIPEPWCKPINSVFMGPLFPLVPYDRYLHLFHKTLNRYPKSAHEYPEQLETVLDGLKFVSARVPALPSLGLPPANETATDSAVKRTLDNDRGGHTFNRINVNRRKAGSLELNKHRPWPNAEFEWLEAFIAVCGYMSRMQEKWYKAPNKLDTVADFWKKHLVVVNTE